MKYRLLLITLLVFGIGWGQIISQYVETNSGLTPKGIEIWNNTGSTLNFSTNNLIIQQGTNGAAVSTIVTINNGTLDSGGVIVIGTSDIGTYLTGQGLTGLFTSYNFSFNGDDALEVKYGSTTTDIFGTPGSDPGTSWLGSGVNTANQNIELISGITSGASTGWTDPSLRFSTISTSPSTLPAGLAGFGIPPTSTTTWNGNAWSNGDPTSSVDAIIDSDLTTSGDLTCKDLTINAGNTLTIDATNSLTVAVNLVNNGNLVFKSDASGTAVFDQFSGTISGSGNATVERYIPAKRGWRLLTAPLKGGSNTSIFYNWQNNGAASDGLTGVTLWNPAGTATPTSSNAGLFQGPQANIYSYSNGWSAVTNTNTSTLFELSENNVFLVFATGPHATSTILGSAAAIPSTLTPKGNLITGTVTKTLVADQYNLIGNPYASAINPVSLIATNTGVNAKIWMIDPTTGYGSYAAYDGTNWVPSTPTGGDAYIQSGQGFFVRTTGTSFTINETDKVTGNSNTWFARTTATATQTNDSDKIRVMLYKQDNNQWQLADGILAVNSSTGNNDVDATDTPKISNFNESLMFRNATSNLSIEYRALPQAGTVQAMRLTSTTVQPYELRLFTENYSNSNLQPFLEDTTTGIVTAIPTDGTILTVPFTGVAATSTNPDQRFRISYQNSLTAEDFTELWASIYPNPLKDGVLNIQLNALEVPAQFELTNVLGQVVHKAVLSDLQNTLSLPPVAKGLYGVVITQGSKRFASKIVIN